MTVANIRDNIQLLSSARAMETCYGPGRRMPVTDRALDPCYDPGEGLLDARVSLASGELGPYIIYVLLPRSDGFLSLIETPPLSFHYGDEAGRWRGVGESETSAGSRVIDSRTGQRGPGSFQEYHDNVEVAETL